MSKSGTRIYVSPGDIISLYENNLVTLTVGSESFSALEPRRLFPVSRSDSYITLLNEDGEELAIIRNLGDLNKESREVIEYSLNDYYLVPHVLKILSVSEKNGICSPARHSVLSGLYIRLSASQQSFKVSEKILFSIIILICLISFEC